MLVNITKKEKAISLRKEGKTYSEILKQVSVAKSTLSEWFRGVDLSKKQIQIISVKKLEAAKRGGLAKHVQRVKRTREIFNKSLGDIRSISKRELWLIGIVLYWAEGTKEKESHPGSSLNFNNSDPRMIKVFVKWLIKSCNVKRNRITFEIYIHENSKNDVGVAKMYWAKVTGFPVEVFTKVYFKKNKIKTNRKNKKGLYFGLLRVKVKRSSSLLRHVAGWTEAIARSIK